MRTLGERQAELRRQRADEARLASELESASARLEQEEAARRARAEQLDALERETLQLPHVQEQLVRMQDKYKLLKLLADTERQAAELERGAAERQAAVSELRMETSAGAALDRRPGGPARRASS